MPYSQASHLAAMNEYLEALGLTDIAQLGYGSGAPPADDAQLFAGSIWMSSGTITGALGQCRQHLLHPASHNSMHTGRLPETRVRKRYRRFNELYNGVLARLDRLTLAFILEDDRRTILAADLLQIVINRAHLLVDALQSKESVVDVDPIGYREVIERLNAVSARTKIGFPRLSSSQFGVIIPPPPNSRLPTLEEFRVRPEDIRVPLVADESERLQPGFVQVKASELMSVRAAVEDKLTYMVQRSFPDVDVQGNGVVRSMFPSLFDAFDAAPAPAPYDTQRRQAPRNSLSYSLIPRPPVGRASSFPPSPTMCRPSGLAPAHHTPPALPQPTPTNTLAITSARRRRPLGQGRNPSLPKPFFRYDNIGPAAGVAGPSTVTPAVTPAAAAKAITAGSTVSLTEAVDVCEGMSPSTRQYTENLELEGASVDAVGEPDATVNQEMDTSAG
ncbi:Gag-pol polyprotein [Mycena indigotica]|uniref:Gag-pol polyprotein n=1 Tax=Mycena indigotica TaxID=2126181 RepID=A0A8H6SQI4_9AGAR|nr:Gag-pol polyprotein [Mycena indigotica]KAF7303353.1 Gag-pol polyprotein [Mycena indigotica]